MAKIAASVLNADFSKSSKWLPELAKARVDRIQFDIMDGKFVPNTGVDKKFISQLRPKTKIFFETHLMVEKPQDYVEEFASEGMGNGMIIFHTEASKKPLELISKIHALGLRAGIAINNNTPAQKIFPFLGEVELALVMGVDAGFGGQKFGPAALEKISALRKKIDTESFSCEIEVDGGINAQTAGQCVKAGADVLVAGTFIFRHPKGIAAAVSEMRRQ